MSRRRRPVSPTRLWRQLLHRLTFLLIAGALPILCAWVKDCARKSVEEGRAVRLSRFKYPPPRPPTIPDGRSKRYLRLTYEETEKFARLYARWARKEISRREMLERMQSQFFDGVSPYTLFAAR
jgi:hypothetical protein